MIPPAECQQQPAELSQFEPGVLPPPAQELAHARAVADALITYTDTLHTEATELRLVASRCAAWSRRTAEEQRQALEPRR